MDEPKRIKFFNLQMDNLNYAQLFTALDARLKSGKQSVICFLNAHCFNVAQENYNYKNALLKSDFILNDGIGVKKAGELIGVHFEQNMCGTDLIPFLIEKMKNRKMFLLGAKQVVIETAASKLIDQGVNVVGYQNGYCSNDKMTVDKINLTDAEIVIVGMGVPYQELWINEHKKEMPNVLLFVAGGAIFDFISQITPRAPRWVRAVHAEWLFRLLLEPRRLFGRYVIGNAKFIYRVLAYKKRKVRTMGVNHG